VIGEAPGAGELVLRVVGVGGEAVHLAGASSQPPECGLLVVAGGREGDQLPIPRPQTVAQEAEVLLRLVAGELVDERQRPAPAVEGVGVRRQDGDPAIAAVAVDEPLGYPKLLAQS
jgi:hypothetical protein